MILKLIGSTIIISASSFLGYIFSKNCSRRPIELKELQSLLYMFENEISFLSNVLTDAFTKIYQSSNSNIAIFFKGTVKKLLNDPGITASNAWESAVRENILTTALNKEDEEILVSFGKMLGNSDLDGQIKNIHLTLSQLELQEEKAEENKKKNERMYRSLGCLGGMAIVFILI